MKRVLWGLVIVLVGMLLAACQQPSQPETLPSRNVITPGAPATPYPNSQLDYGGIYQFFDPKGSTPSFYQDGSHQVIPWYELEPMAGVYDWSDLDSYVADRAAWGLDIGLGFNTVDYSPYYCASVGGTYCWTAGNREDRIWLPADMLDAADENSAYVVCPQDTSYPKHRLPKYWGGPYQSAYEDFVYALASHINTTPLLKDNIDWIELPIGVYGELNPGQFTDAACLQALGLTQALWEQTVTQMIDIWVDAFAGSGIDLSFQGTNTYIAKDTRKRMNDYAASQGLGLQHAKWQPDWEDMAVACPSCWSRGMGMVDAPLRWENQVSFAVEVPDPPLWGDAYRTTMNHPEQDYWNMAFFLDLKGDIYKARLQTDTSLKRLTLENPWVANMATTLNTLAGTDEQNAPFAAVWMRETEHLSFPWWPKCNNFDFYLYASTAQEPRVGSSCPGLNALTTDGQAVPVYNLDATYAPGLCPNDRVYSETCDPRYRYARQTTTGQPYIYLDVDPGYRYGTGINAAISVDYLDVGTDQIKLQWHNGSAVQTETHTKTNTRQWRTWTLSLTNMDLTDRFTSGATAWDFRLWDGGDGVETIHSVKFEPSSGGTPAAPTATPTATATPAPTATPWVLRIDPSNSSWEDALIWLTRPDNTYASLPTYSLRANSDQATNVPIYNTTVASLLVEVPFSLPPNTTLNRAALYLTPTGGYLPDAMTLVLRPVIAEWSLPSWRNRINPDPVVGGVFVPWATPGAYGTGDVGEPFGSIQIRNDDINASLPIALDVSGAVQPGGGLALKIEPWCTPRPSSWDCEGFAYFAGSVNQNLGIRPYLELDVISNAPPTSTPTPTRTPTPIGHPPGTSTPTPTATAVGGPTRTPTPYPPSLREGLVINEVCSNPVTTDNVPDGVMQGDSAVELFNSNEFAVDLSDYRLCVNTTCLWLEGTVQPFGYKVFYQQWDGLVFLEGGANTIRLERAGVPPVTVVDTLSIQNQTDDHCWAAVTDASPTYVEKYPPTLGRGNNLFQ